MDHDVAIALFHITENQDQISMEISFDIEDLSNSMNVKEADISLENLEEYFSENTSFLFNGNMNNFDLIELKTENDHLKVKGQFSRKMNDIRSLTITNTCLIEVAKHSNIIQIDLNDTSRDFRMHKGRTKIELRY